MKNFKLDILIYFLVSVASFLFVLITKKLPGKEEYDFITLFLTWAENWFYASVNILILIICIKGFLSLFNPLTEKQISDLARKRRKKHLDKYYFISNFYTPFELDFKKNMNPKGTFYPIHTKLNELPYYIANLLKYKKHEWIAIVFEKNQLADLLWVNKGDDNMSVHFKITSDDIIKMALEKNSSTVLFFHNHPNSYPQNISLSRPSETDLNSARLLAEDLTKQKINMLDFVCDRGKPFLYWQAIHDNFYPLKIFYSQINEFENNISKSQNFKLNLERIF